MSAKKFKFTFGIDDLLGVATLSDGIQEATIPASFEGDLWTLIFPVRILLWGANESRCSWRGDPGEYRWLFLRQDDKLFIHVLWFKEYLSRSDEQGETVLQIECDLLTFAKRFSQQLNQLDYQENPSAPLPEVNKDLQASIKAYEQTKREQQRNVLKSGKNK
ncbi:hypothetical protein KSD_35210 [Ktedonobacter sp. SOSP1-85]|uniref:hypothetical protein n=1 Tax=Ktedonobacter sp. SOSP1-85 TaxID=2778367 RepID=UPI0019164BF0|nr:hypothetical protein [Ktedonobacter sp. SOSP1-85]GHO75750.1 hypothetical protein KSD_35210 [Ktedonobacter sp. SOSP1-85]